ncbi:delta-12 fatty acid desaturase protein [Sistotremastrum suecicum HHB10207 ss-3]|uniref:Delta-12 fatty acid desaturase protein n=1 Tax=Sistotremastrum suecicum HHB10207 ss-3 TaxID=1314776 RepID=A0A166HEJ0_9AGAM|nr:delta-12 fatty acid desaturase protein [Sistotremastrum suecicum HHB10207 ss-3]
MSTTTTTTHKKTDQAGPIQYKIPDLTVKDLLSSIPKHCFERSAIKSSAYIVLDVILLTIIYKTASFANQFITPEYITLPHPALYSVLYFSLWAFYGFAAGLPATGLWVIAHECGHQAFSESKFINNSVGWVLHSALGVPYHSWRISHAKHHAATGHLTQDQVFVPATRSMLGLPKFNPNGEDLHGTNVSKEVQNELWEAIGDSPISAAIQSAGYLLVGWPLYIIQNSSGQTHYPKGTSHFVPKAPLYAPHQTGQVLISDLGILIWLGTLAAWAYTRGFAEMFRIYFVPYLWVNHWLVLITFLQHTDPILPHYRAPEFTFPRGALSTLDRSLLGDLGSFAGWIGATATHGISETHVLHHVSSKIPHYNAWEASDALRKRLAQEGLVLEGPPGGWSEMYRCFKECKFVEDEGNVVFYKNARGLAVAVPVLPESTVSDSGVDVQ